MKNDDVEKIKEDSKVEAGFFHSCLNWISVFGILVISLLFSFKLFCNPILILGDSMNPTLQDNQLWFSRAKQLGKPKKTDIVVAYEVLTRTKLVKRVVATEGDVLTVLDSGLYVNRSLVDKSKETMGLIEDKSSWLGSNKGLSVTLQEGEYFLLGDNRENSNDSRDLGIFPDSTISSVLTVEAPNFLRDLLVR
jgi:signal peptidase I